MLFPTEPNDDDLEKTLLKFPNSTVITVSNHAANRVNSVVINRIADKSKLLGYATSDCNLGKIPIFQEMRNKQQRIVNGRTATVPQMQGNTVILKSQNNNVVQVYPVSSLDENKKKLKLFCLSYQLMLLQSLQHKVRHLTNALYGLIVLLLHLVEPMWPFLGAKHSRTCTS